MSNSLNENSILGRINNLLSEINQMRKQAASSVGETTHPIDDLDGNNYEIEPGSRAQENQEDMDSQYGDVGVDNVEGDYLDQEEVQLQQNLRQSETGGDPDTEDNYKGELKDPGTESPADFSEVGEKYSSIRYDHLSKAAYSRMYEVLSDLIDGSYTQKSAAFQSNNSFANIQNLDEFLKNAAEGYNLADLIINELQEKTAGQNSTEDEADDQTVKEVTAQALYDAAVDADLVGIWLKNLEKNAAQLNYLKLANDMMAGGAAPGALPPEMMNELVGGAGMMGMGAPPGPGQDSAGEEPPFSYQPLFGRGSDSSETSKTDEKGSVSSDESKSAPSDIDQGSPSDYENAINELVNALVEAGIPPEELLDAAQEQASIADSAADSLSESSKSSDNTDQAETKEETPENKSKKAAYINYYKKHAQNMRKLAKLASAAKRHIQNGKFRFKVAAPGTSKRKERDELISYVLEVCGR